MIDKKTLEDDKTDLLGPINYRINLLRAGKRIGTSLMSDEETFGNVHEIWWIRIVRVGDHLRIMPYTRADLDF